jgi:polar amino acid transport system substrate-binding protein/cystine transport system substrate-binding protein/membrane-bound lytic murein transglycosylase F
MRTLRDASVVLAVISLLGLAYLLPPDSSWARVRRGGVLRVCVPESYPPLVTGEAQAPGIDVEILTTMADRLGLTLQLVTNPAIGRDFNPRNWRVTRAQCQLLAGGVVASGTTTSFLETTPAYLETGWAMVGPSEAPSVVGRTVAVLAGATGLDRIALSRYLKARGADVRLVATTEALVDAIHGGAADVGVTEALAARRVAGVEKWRVRWLPEAGPRQGLVFGLWKGDLTLKRKLVHTLEQMERAGVVRGIVERYRLANITP